MQKLTNNLIRLKENYAALKMGFVFDSIIEGNTPAEIFANDVHNPTISIVCEGHGFYFGGEAIDRTQYYEAVNFFKEQILDENRKRKLGIAKIYYSSEIWKKILIESLNEYKPRSYEKILFQHRLEEISHHPNNDPDLIIKEIDRELINSQLGYVEPVINEIKYMWGSLEKFYKDGFGYCAIKDQNIVSWCTAEYKSQKYCGIGIETIEDYQKQGIATITAYHLLKKCLHLNLIPHWDCWKSNIPSVKVAEKNGFKKLTDYNILFIRF